MHDASVINNIVIIKNTVIIGKYLWSNTWQTMLLYKNSPCWGSVMPLPPQTGFFSYNRMLWSALLLTYMMTV